MAGCRDDGRRRFFVDIETYSSEDIKATGAFRYMEAPDFEILLIAYAWDQGPVQVLDLASGLGDTDTAELDSVIDALESAKVVKVAHNAAFERAAFRVWDGQYMDPAEWEDTMIIAAYNGLPMSLDAAGAALGLKDQKIKEGTTLISYFCKPCKPTKANGGRTRNLPEHSPDKWERFVQYCKRDVEVAQAIYYRLPGPFVPEWEKALWSLDCSINERGVLIDRELVLSATAVDQASREASLAEMQRLTGLDNPNSVAQLKGWLADQGIQTDQLNKATVSELLPTVSSDVRRVLELRQLLGKTSTKKYDAMLAAASPKDDRIRGILQYYGAGRTGRWAGRLVQVQNLPQNHLEDIGTVRELVRDRDLDTMQMCFDSVPDTLSQLIRTALVAPEEHTFLVADYSAIEARVSAYLPVSSGAWRSLPPAGTSTAALPLRCLKCRSLSTESTEGSGLRARLLSLRASPKALWFSLTEALYRSKPSPQTCSCGTGWSG